MDNDADFNGIAIIGMAGRFPGAVSVKQFWQNLCNGVESIPIISDEALLNAGVSEELIKNPDYVKRIASIKDIDLFDAEFFGINPREAELMDPQHRLFLECAWEALEDSGYDPEKYNGLIGVYAGNGMNHYLLNNLASNPDLQKTVGDYQIMIGNANDFLSTRVSYKLNLRGPSITLLTACSTSMVAIHTACQSLLSYQCDMALAGAVSLRIPPNTGYLYNKGHILSPDGHCRAFDVEANGTAWGEGLGIIILKRFNEAIENRDTIYAVIKSTAINNDGSGKVGFTAPSVNGQADVIRLAHALADVKPQDISYVEAHGTGTPMGDPIELAGLAKAFKSDFEQKNYCALGSVKTNIGHLDTAAGVAGIIKTALALKNKQIPPTLHFTKPNPNLNIENSPFFVNTKLLPWTKYSGSRIAGISSFGIGGTNAHAILEEAPEIKPSQSSKSWHILPISARSENALECATRNLAEQLNNDDSINIADVAYTLQVGRRAFTHRKTIVCQSHQEAVDSLVKYDVNRVRSGECIGDTTSAVFMFSGQGSQYINMSKQLYENEPFYKEKFNYCGNIISPLIGIDLCKLLFPSENDFESVNNLLSQTKYTQPAIFALEYSLACLFMNWGIKPNSLIGHSIGELVAACISGVFKPEDALWLVVERAKIMQQQPPGVMLSILASENVIKEYIENNVEIALINGPQSYVLGGTAEAINLLNKKLLSSKIPHSRLHTSHAFHSFLMDGAIEPFAKCVAKVPRQAPTIPFISNVTGTWITTDQAQDPMYWASHIRNTVKFSDGIDTVLKNSNTTLIEIGPGNTLCTLASMQLSQSKSMRVIQTISHAKQQRPDMELFYNAIGQLWTLGIQVDWKNCYTAEPRYRISLPTYPFERQRYWVEPSMQVNNNAITSAKKDIESNVQQTTISKIRTHNVHPRPQLPYDYVEPSNDIEKQLSEIWQLILGIEPIGINDNFFDLGGHSLLAVQMFSRIKKLIGVDLQLASLFTAPTIVSLSKLITPQNISIGSQNSCASKDFLYVVPIKPSGKFTPFFCVHCVGGNVLNYYNFLPYLDSNQPFFGIQCRGLDGIQKPFESIQFMAKSYIVEMKRIQPKGPYLIGGGSMGGLVAFEMAQQLTKNGDSVKLLAMLDSGCPYVVNRYIKSIPRDELNEKINRKKRTLVKQIQHSINCRVDDFRKYSICNIYRLKRHPIPHELRYWLIEQKHLALLDNYKPEPYYGLITMFRALHNKQNPDPSRGWIEAAKGEIKYIDLECDHTNIIEHIETAKFLNKTILSYST